MPSKGHSTEPEAQVTPAVTPAVAPAGPAWLSAGAGFAPVGALAPRVLALSRAAGNAAVARAIAGGRLVAREAAAPAAGDAAPPVGAHGTVPTPGVAREPAAPAAAGDAAAPAAVPEAPVEGAPELSRAPFAELLAAVEAWSPREDTLQAYLATPGVDGKRLALADTIVMRKESGADEAAVIEIAQELYILGTPVADRDAVFTYLGFGGLALPSSIEAFASASTAAAAAIATMNTFAERAAAVRGVINARLTAVGVPPVGPITAEGGGNAHFKKQDWTVSVDPDFAMRGGPSAPGELLTAVYHEARHAEQDFLVARHMARDRNAAEIAAEHEVPLTVAEAAKASPLPADDPQAQLAERLRGPIPDTGPDPELAAIRPRLIEKKQRGEEFTPEEKAIMDRAYQRYRNRPNEADAFLVEALAKQQQSLAP